MTGTAKRMRIAQLSDSHLIDGRYEERLLDAAGERELLARYPRPLEPIGEHRCVEATRVVRRQRGGTFHTETREGAREVEPA